MKVLCKKSVLCSGVTTKFKFECNKYYNCTSTLNLSIIEGFVFWYNPPSIENTTLFLFEDYFYTIPELRKIKLDKINKYEEW